MRAFWREGGKSRCDGCGLHLDLCACATMPRLQLDTSVLIVQHAKERALSSTTSRLVTAMFADSRLIVHGAKDERFAEEELRRPDCDYALLFPRRDARPLEHGPPPWKPGKRRVLVVLDGTWGQASRMAARIDALRSLPSFALRSGAPSPWRVRHSHDPERLCTFESTLRAIALTEGLRPEMVTAERCFYEVTARLLFMRSKLSRPEIPPDWNLHLARTIHEYRADTA